MSYTKVTFQIIIAALFTSFVFLSASCKENTGNSLDSFTADRQVTSQSKFVAKGGPNVVEVTTIHDHDANKHLFEVSEEEVPSGWTTFRLNNRTHSDHFYLLYKVPQAAIEAADAADRSVLDHWYQSVTVPFQEQWNPYINGEIDFGVFVGNLFEAVLSSAPWFVEAGTMGGPGITAAGLSSETTVYLSSGTYLAECYVKDENQEFHSYNGMLDIIKVTDESSKEKEPRATMDVSISQSGIDFEESVRPGMHTVAIHFGEQPTGGYGHLLGHNVQLVRLEDGYDQSLLDELGAWMNWTTEEGLVNRAPSGATFLGGSMEMAGDNKAYYHVNLKPGNYAWIAEVPNPADKNMLKTFKVPSSSETGRR